MKKIIYSIALVALTFTSCTGDLEDQINDLEGQLDQTNLIADSVEITHEYSYNEDNPINETMSLGLSSPSQQIIQKHGNNGEIYYIQISNSLSIDGNNSFNLSFYYDNENEKILTSNDGYYTRMRFEQLNKYGDNIYFNEYLYENNLYQELALNINSIDIESGKINFDVTFEYTEDYYYSTYNTSGLLTATFNGTLNTFEAYPTEESSETAIQVTQLK